MIYKQLNIKSYIALSYSLVFDQIAEKISEPGLELHASIVLATIVKSIGVTVNPGQSGF